MSEANKIRVFYLRDENRFPVACVASRKLTPSFVEYGISVFNPSDTYCRHTGRELAIQRLDDAWSVYGGMAEIGDGSMPVKANIMREITQNEILPQRARDAAQLWLDVHQPEITLEKLLEILKSNIRAMAPIA